MTPDYRNANPYQTLLAKALESGGVITEFSSQPFYFFPRHSADRGFFPPPAILHLHWIEPFISGASPIARWARASRLIFCLLVLRLAGTTIIWTPHNLVSHEDVDRKTERTVRRIVARLAHRLIAHSEASANEMVSAYDLPKRKIFVISHGNYRGVYGETIERRLSKRRLGLSPDGHMFLFFGVLRPYKGIPALIRAWQLFARDQGDCVLFIVGKPGYEGCEASLRALAAGSSNIHFVFDFVPDEYVARYFSAADFAVFPFESITTSGSVSLALSFSVPVIAPRFPQLEEAVGLHTNFLYSPGSDEALADMLRRASAVLKNDHAPRSEPSVETEWPQVAARHLHAYGFEV